MQRIDFPGLLALAFVAVLAGCEAQDPFAIPWTEDPGENTLYALDRQELNRPSAFNMFERTEVIVEGPYAEGRWDFAVDRQDGQFVLLPPRALGVTSRAGIVPVTGANFEDLREAPADTAAYITDEPVPMELGAIYIIRTHDQSGQFGRQCQYYGRLEPIRMDLEAGTFTFSHDTSPQCNNRRLVPPGS